jgi:hypothetical protein
LPTLQLKQLQILAPKHGGTDDVADVSIFTACCDDNGLHGYLVVLLKTRLEVLEGLHEVSMSLDGNILDGPPFSDQVADPFANVRYSCPKDQAFRFPPWNSLPSRHCSTTDKVYRGRFTMSSMN